MEQYNVTGMSCAACSARVEKAVKKVPGVTSCSVSLLTNSMGVEGTASPAAILSAVQEAGYGASPKNASARKASDASADLDALADHETPKLKRRLIASLGFLLVLMYFSMGHMMWGWPLPHWFDGNHVAMGLVQLLLAGIVKKNAIMLIDFALDASRVRRLPPDKAIYEACLLRFRPIMMTTAAAILGAVPLALGQGDGAEIRQPLGITIVGGLLVSQVLTLYTTPVVYLCLDRARLRARRFWWRLRYGSARAARLAVLSRRG